MIAFTLNGETKAAVVAALAVHGTDRLAVAGLGRVTRDESALATGSIMTVWPADEDGIYRISLNDNAAMIAWRAYILAEIADGRGERRKHLDGYKAAFGIETEPAFAYIVAATKGRGVRPCNLTRTRWSDFTAFVALSGAVREPSKRWASSMWRGRARAHGALADAGVALPGRSTWSPVATCLFDEPKRVVPTPTLTPADHDALAQLAA